MNGISVLLDTNIIIYYLQGNKDAKSLVRDNFISISYITVIELLGYRKNSKKDIKLITKLISTFDIIYSNKKIMNSAITLRNKYKTKTPDSIIGATAMFLDMPIITADSDLFNIKELITIQFLA